MVIENLEFFGATFAEWMTTTRAMFSQPPQPALDPGSCPRNCNASLLVRRTSGLSKWIFQSIAMIQNFEFEMCWSPGLSAFNGRRRHLLSVLF